MIYLAEQVIKLYTQSQQIIALAESCTGGMISAALTDIAGSSAVLESSLVTYSNQAKIDLLGVSKQIIDTFGAVSQETSIAMVEGLLKKRPVDVGLSVTGIAGPGGGSVEKPVGRVHFAVSAHGKTHHFQKDFGDISRADIRKASTVFALTLLKCIS